MKIYLYKSHSSIVTNFEKGTFEVEEKPKSYRTQFGGNILKKDVGIVKPQKTPKGEITSMSLHLLEDDDELARKMFLAIWEEEEKTAYEEYQTRLTRITKAQKRLQEAPSKW